MFLHRSTINQIENRIFSLKFVISFYFETNQSPRSKMIDVSVCIEKKFILVIKKI